MRLANFNLLKSSFLTQSLQLSSKMTADDLSISVLCTFFFFIVKIFLWKLTGQLASWSQFSITLGIGDKIIWTFVDNFQTSLNHSSLSISKLFWEGPERRSKMHRFEVYLVSPFQTYRGNTFLKIRYRIQNMTRGNKGKADTE